MLSRALLDLSPPEFNTARALLHGSCCVFVGKGFAEAPKVAFQVRVRFINLFHLALFASTSQHAKQYLSVLKISL
jgi:hypothetical protein